MKGLLQKIYELLNGIINGILKDRHEKLNSIIQESALSYINVQGEKSGVSFETYWFSLSSTKRHWRPLSNNLLKAIPVCAREDGKKHTGIWKRLYYVNVRLQKTILLKVGSHGHLRRWTMLIYIKSTWVLCNILTYVRFLKALRTFRLYFKHRSNIM